MPCPPAAAARADTAWASSKSNCRRMGRVVLRGQSASPAAALRMDRGVENLMRMAGLPLGQAVTHGTRIQPSRRRSRPYRGLAPGERADMVEFRFDPASLRIEVLATWMSGRKCSAEPPYRSRASAPRWIAAAPAIPVSADTHAGRAPRRFHSSWTA